MLLLGSFCGKALAWGDTAHQVICEVAFRLAQPATQAEVQRLISLGASRKADVTMGGMRWTTLLDPEGNEFDVIAEAA